MGHDALAASAKHHAIRAMLVAWLGGTLILLLILFVPWGLLGWAKLMSPAAKIAAAAVGSAAAQALLPLDALGERHLRTLRAKSATGRLANVAEEMSLATGHRPGDVLIYDSEIPNVGGFPSRNGVVVMATTGAVDSLERGELQALVAAQFAGMEDPWCRRATKAEFSWAFAIIGAFLSFFFSPVAFWAGLLLLFLPRWIENTRDLCADVAAVAATRNPTALANGLRHLRPAARSAHKLEIGSLLITASPFLVLPKRIESTRTSTRGNKAERRYTSADEIAVELALRADRAEALARGDDPKQFTGAEYRRRFSKLGTEDHLTSSETKKSDAMAVSLGVDAAATAKQHREKVSKERQHALAAEHFPPDHAYWMLKAKSDNNELGLRDAPKLLKMAAELGKIEQAHLAREKAAAATSSGATPGWYSDPMGAPHLRWWDGRQWTEHTHQSNVA